MSTVVLLLVTGLGLGALYFLVASGLSLIYGLMGVLNFAHGVVPHARCVRGLGDRAPPGRRTPGSRCWSRSPSGAAAGALAAVATELLLIRRLYERHIEQVLVTVGLALATVALFDGIWGTDAIFVTGPRLVRRDHEHPRRRHPERPVRPDRGGGARPAGASSPSCGSPGSGW